MKLRENKMITPRDIDIFKTLVSGPSTFKHILQELNSMGRRDPKSEDDRGESYGRKTTTAALKVRLLKLGRQGYITSRRYWDRQKGGVIALYVLGHPALEELVSSHGYKVNHIRNMLPSPDKGTHEMLVTSLVRAVRREALRNDFDLDYEDENWLKSTLGGPKKGMSYPDLYVKLVFKMGGGLRHAAHLGLEIDNLSMSHRRMFDKARYIFQERKWYNMILSNKRIRCDSLQQSFFKYVDQEIRRASKMGKQGSPENLYRCAYFTTTGNFITKGILSTKWLTIGGTEMEIIPANAEARKDATK
jgi:hypothetical protein